MTSSALLGETPEPIMVATRPVAGQYLWIVLWPSSLMMRFPAWSKRTPVGS